MADLPDSADIIIIGGGVIGLSTACHLGWRSAENDELDYTDWEQQSWGVGANLWVAGGPKFMFNLGLDHGFQETDAEVIVPDEMGETQTVNREPVAQTAVSEKIIDSQPTEKSEDATSVVDSAVTSKKVDRKWVWIF